MSASRPLSLSLPRPLFIDITNYNTCIRYYTCTRGDSLVRLSSVSLAFLILKWHDASDDEWILNDALSIQHTLRGFIVFL